MMKFRYLLLPLALIVCAPLPAADWSVQPGARLGFEATAQGETFHGEFKTFAASIRFDPADLDGARFEVDIDLGSVDSRNSERDEMLADAAFFDSGRQPKARYVAERFVALDDGRFRAEGVLTLRGVSQPVPLAFSWQVEGEGATLKGEATLDRIAFGVGGGEWSDAEVIGHQVRVSTELSLTP